MKSLIITADDYGMSKSVNDAIEEGMERSVITSTNVMVNMPFYTGAAEVREKFPDASIGLHWNLTVGKPVTVGTAVRTITDSEGNFCKPAELLKRYRENKVSADELKLELMNQYNMFESVCGKPDYWNTHENIHMHLGIFEVFLKLAWECQMGKMRWHAKIWSEEAYKALGLKRHIMEYFKSAVLSIWKAEAKKKHMAFPHGLIVVNHSLASLNDKNTKIMWEASEIGELTMHPAKSIDSGFFGDMTESRVNEYKALADHKLVDEIMNKYKLVNFDAVK